MWLQLTAIAPTALCPDCAVPSSSIHSRYQRHLTDLPWGTPLVRIQLMVRKFVCRHVSCARRIFMERLPELVATYARKTQRFITVLQVIGIALGGQAGVRLAARLRLPTSASTLLRLVRAAPLPYLPALQVIGVEWAWRRGHRYGTILVDVAMHHVVDLLPDRSAASVAARLAQHPTIAVVCRDRRPLYADGIHQGAPDAVQVVDRFHLVENFCEAVEASLRNQRGALQAAAVRTAQALTSLGSAVPVTPIYQGRRRSPKPQQHRAESERQPRHAPWVEIYAALHTLHAQGIPVATIARERRGHELEAWMAEATHRGIDELARFVRGLQEDLAAVTAGLTIEWSNGVTEGQIHRLKLTKRQGYGRAGFALLRQRVLQVA